MSNNTTLNDCIVYSLILRSKNGVELDLKYVFTEIEIYEDFFSKYLKGIIKLKDTTDLVKNFPIIGGEELSILFTDNVSNSARSLDFYITAVLPQSQISDENKKNPYIILKFDSVEAIHSKQKRISKKFDNSDTSIINDLMNLIESDKIFNNFDSNDIKFVSNYWNVDEVIEYICQQSMDSFFFQTTDQFVYAKLNDLIKQSPIQELFFVKNLESLPSVNTVIRYYFDKYFDLMSMYNFKGFGRTVFEPSIDKYLFKKETKLLSEIYGDDYKLMGLNQPFKKDLSTEYNDVLTSFNDFDSRLKRNLIIQTLQNYNLVVQMNGSVKRRVGDVVTFMAPAFDNGVINESFQDEWLMLQIKHKITADMRYTQNIRLFKNAFFANQKVG